jgi:histidinol phosphatase-like enzyme
LVHSGVLVSRDPPRDPQRRAPRLRDYRDEGYRLLGISWRPDIGDGTQSEDAIKDSFAHACRRLGLELDVECCPHPAGPPRCWCRKPLPGLGILFINRYRLDPAQCLYIGQGPHDAGFARRVGFTFAEA